MFNSQTCRTFIPLFAFVNVVVFTLLSYLISSQLGSGLNTAIDGDEEFDYGVVPASLTSMDGLRVFALGRPAMDADWNASTIFGGDSRFLNVGVFRLKNTGGGSPQPSLDRLLNSFSWPLLNSTCSSAVICDRSSNGGGLSNVECRQVANCSMSEDAISDRTSHIYLNLSTGSLLVSQIFAVSPTTKSPDSPRSYFFCYGLPSDVISVHPQTSTNNNNNNNCPPCLCPAVFAGETLTNNLAIQSTKRLKEKSLIANRLLKNSRFVLCLGKNESQIQKPSDIYVVGDAPHLGAEKSWAVRQFFEVENKMPLMLEGGTLLGWYRNCSVVVDDVDVDFSVPSSAINQDFYKNLVQNAYHSRQPVKRTFSLPNSTQSISLKSTRIFGDLDYGVEVRFDVKKENEPRSHVVGIDIFILYMADPKLAYSYVQGFVTWEHVIMQYAMPKNVTMCSTIFFGDIYLVPCEPDLYLASHYGANWRSPQGRQDSYWRNQPNIVRRIQLTPQDWQQRIMFKSFEYES